MSELAGIRGRRHFSPEVEDALRRDDATSAVVKTATGTQAEIGGKITPGCRRSATSGSR